MNSWIEVDIHHPASSLDFSSLAIMQSYFQLFMSSSNIFFNYQQVLNVVTIIIFAFLFKKFHYNSPLKFLSLGTLLAIPFLSNKATNSERTKLEISICSSSSPCWLQKIIVGDFPGIFLNSVLRNSVSRSSYIKHYNEYMLCRT